jgi:protease IV
LTGSIGVYGGKFAYGEALSRFGLDLRDIGVGSPYAAAFAAGKSFTPEQKTAISGWFDEIYNAFIDRVAKGRNIPAERVREIAKGHVWTGEQAKGLKLVDEVGGFYEAVAVAKKLAKIDAKAGVKLVNFPDNSSPFAMFAKATSMAHSGLKALSLMGWAMSDPKAQAILEQMGQARLRAQGAAVLAPTPYQATNR